MNVKSLKAFIASMPDDAEVQVLGFKHSSDTGYVIDNKMQHERIWGIDRLQAIDPKAKQDKLIILVE